MITADKTDGIEFEPPPAPPFRPEIVSIPRPAPKGGTYLQECEVADVPGYGRTARIPINCDVCGEARAVFEEYIEPTDPTKDLPQAAARWRWGPTRCQHCRFAELISGSAPMRSEAAQRRAELATFSHTFPALGAMLRQSFASQLEDPPQPDGAFALGDLYLPPGEDWEPLLAQHLALPTMGHEDTEALAWADGAGNALARNRIMVARGEGYVVRALMLPAKPRPPHVVQQYRQASYRGELTREQTHQPAQQGWIITRLGRNPATCCVVADPSRSAFPV